MEEGQWAEEQWLEQQRLKQQLDEISKSDLWSTDHARVVAWMKHVTVYDALEILQFVTQCEYGISVPATLIGAIRGVIERKGIDPNDL